MIIESLAGKRILVTGATGFLGTALVERLLRRVPDCELVLIVRSGRRSATDRVKRDVLRNDAFKKLRSAFGTASDGGTRSRGAAGRSEEADGKASDVGRRSRAADGRFSVLEPEAADFESEFETFEVMAERRIHVVAGDVSVDGLGLDDAGRALIADCDIAIHAAAAVSFDSALDDAVEVNLLGPMRPGCGSQRGRCTSPSHLRFDLLRCWQPAWRGIRTADRRVAVLRVGGLAPRGGLRSSGP